MNHRRPVAVRSGLLALSLLFGASSCHRAVKPLPKDPRAEERSRFASAADHFVDGVLFAEPHHAVRLSIHSYDGYVPDLSRDGIKAHLLWLARAERTFKRFSREALEPLQRVELDTIFAKIRRDRFVYQTLDATRTQPLMYLRALFYTPYIAHQYAPATRRARALADLARGAPKLLGQAERRLDKRLARPHLQIALFMATRMAKAARGLPEVLRAQGATIDEAMARDLAQLPRALDKFAAALTRRVAHATAPFALGKARYVALMRSMGVELDLARFEALAQRELDKHRRAIIAAARKLDRTRPPAQVIARVLADRVSPDDVFALARRQLARLRALLVRKKIVTIPSSEQTEVVATPPFMRYNFAFLNAPGIFNGPRTDLPSYFYISPPDPSWPAKKRRDYVAATPALLFVSAHEVWPGHFLDFLHAKGHRSRVLRALRSDMRTEGWAHYVEQMVLDDALGHGDPKLVIGMLSNALLRDARFLASIGLHTKGKSLAWAAALFRNKAFVDAGNAQQQALRGTFDPSYFRYTVGKLMIQKLRADMIAKAGGKLGLARFHDRFLGCCAMAPIPAIRRALLGDDAGPAL